MDIQHWLLFASIAFIATISPGPAVLLATSHSMSYGWKYAVFTILGNITGLFIMSALSVAGLSAIILNSALIFTLVKFAGALYLIYLGIKIWRNGFANMSDNPETGRAPRNRNKLYLQGLTIALSNPKAIAFTTALFPQFIDHQQPLAGQFAALVGTFMFLSFACLVVYAYLAEHTKTRLFNGGRGYLNKVLGAGFVASGVALANVTHKHA